MFKKFICYDPQVNPPVGDNASTAPEVKFSAENPPKTKEDWQKLSQSDPKTWMDLTQANTDRMFRENRELQEKLDRERQEKENLTVEVNRYKTPPAPVVDNSGQPIYSINNFPKTEQEWDALALERPTFASDLRFSYLNRQQAIDTEYQRAHANYRKEVQAEHPDMYLCEIDSSGNPLKDDKGNIIHKLSATGEPIYNPQSEKGKLWEQIYLESRRPDGTNPLNNAPNAPRLMMAELERRLVKKGQAIIDKNTPPKQNHVAGPGVPPPVQVKVSFGSKDEEAHVESAIQRGTWKNKEEYCEARDNGTSGFYDSNRRPDFSKK